MGCVREVTSVLLPVAPARCCAPPDADYVASALLLRAAEAGNQILHQPFQPFHTPMAKLNGFGFWTLAGPPPEGSNLLSLEFMPS